MSKDEEISQGGAGLFGDDDDDEHDIKESVYDPSSNLIAEKDVEDGSDDEENADNSANTASTGDSSGSSSTLDNTGGGTAKLTDKPSTYTQREDKTNSAFEPSRPNRPIILQREIPHQAYPNPACKYVSIKFPPTVRVEVEPFDSGSESSVSAATSGGSQSSRPPPIVGRKPLENDTIRWRFKRDADGNIVKDSNGEPARESNTRLVEWEDGSFTLFIGNQPFDCQIRDDKSYLFEDSHEEVKPLHGITSERFLFVVSQYLGGHEGPRFTSKYKNCVKTRQKTILTSIEETSSSHHDQLQLLESHRDGVRLQKKQKESEKEKGITRDFLENNSPDEDNTDSLSRIKERFGINKKRF